MLFRLRAKQKVPKLPLSIFSTFYPNLGGYYAGESARLTLNIGGNGQDTVCIRTNQCTFSCARLYGKYTTYIRFRFRNLPYHYNFTTCIVIASPFIQGGSLR